MENRTDPKEKIIPEGESGQVPTEGTGIGGTDISGEDSYSGKVMEPVNNDRNDQEKPPYGNMEDDIDRRNNELI